MNEFEGFEAAEVAYVIELLAAMCTTEDIKKKFFEFSFPGKTISAKQIQKISLRYAKVIRERNDAYLRNVAGNPLAHQRVRLDILQRIIDDALTQRPSHSVKVGDDHYEVVTKADNPSAINALKLAMTDLNKREELDISKEKLKLDRPEDTELGEYEVDDGVA